MLVTSGAVVGVSLGDTVKVGVFVGCAVSVAVAVKVGRLVTEIFIDSVTAAHPCWGITVTDTSTT